MLVDVTAIDWMDVRQPRFDVVYQLMSITFNTRMCIRIGVEENDPKVFSVLPLWNAANFLEREVWDLFGITFEGHGDLRRIMMYDEFVGHPLRKDYPVQGKQPESSMAEIRSDWKPQELEDSLHSKTMVLNMGPAHPATHGTIRLQLELDGERIERCDVEPGYLHRGFEKMSETVDYNQVIPYTDRLNYVSPIINNVGYVIAVEKLLDVEVPERAEVIRVIMSELSRMCDHLTCLGAACMELGGFTVMLYLMQARELLYEIIEEVTGARLTISYTRVGGLRSDLPDGFEARVASAFVKIREHLQDGDNLISKNRIFQDRMTGIGIISADEAVDYGCTGPVLRGSGVAYDVRKAFPYCGYEKYEFDVPVGTTGDNLDRFIVRYNEIFESIRIVEQAVEKLPQGPICIDDPKIIMPPKDEVYSSIEGMISQFEMVFKGVQPPAGEVYLPVEGGNGELGFHVVSDGSGNPYRVRIRPPCFLAMGIFGPLLEGHNIADIVPLFGMINMIGGECDR
ncbi:UNVERIFIED_CONTAM: hypothetical protein GTU68_024743 [Idotea baltica]|nr:hypothetical protein [Idotea baltica]